MSALGSGSGYLPDYGNGGDSYNGCSPSTTIVGATADHVAGAAINGRFIQQRGLAARVSGDARPS
jgi:hypothetical protein